MNENIKAIYTFSLVYGCNILCDARRKWGGGGCVKNIYIKISKDMATIDGIDFIGNDIKLSKHNTATFIPFTIPSCVTWANISDNIFRGQ